MSYPHMQGPAFLRLFAAFRVRAAGPTRGLPEQAPESLESQESPPQGLRLFCAMGPGDGAQDLRLWLDGQPSPASLARTYSREIFEACRLGGHHLLAVTSHQTVASESSGRLTVRNLPKPIAARGLRFHWQQWRYGLQLLRQARQFKAQVAILDSGSCSWWVTPLFRIAGMRVVIKLHNAFWAVDEGLSLSRKIRLALGTAWPLRIAGVSVLGVSDLVLEQARRLLGGHRILRRFLPIFPKAFERPADGSSPAQGVGLRVGYIGRIEREKGVHLLVDAALWLNDHAMPGWRINVIGEGSTQAAMAEAVDRHHLGDIFRLLGPMNSSQIEAALSQIDVLVAPSTRAVSEALCKSLIEAALMGVPVVASRSIPAAQMLPASCIPIESDDGRAIAMALQRLATEPALWRSKANGSAAEKAVFLNQAQGLQRALEDLLLALAQGSRPTKP